MTLALVILNKPDFDTIHDHLAAHRPDYKNMHLRQARIRNKQRVLRYLHAMRLVPGNQRKVEGMISGPDVSVHYQLVETPVGVQLNVLSEHGTPKELARLQRQFLREVLVRVAQEQEQEVHHPRYLSGQYYLKRSKDGRPAGHPVCASAASSGALAQRFVSVLGPWGFALIRGR